MIPKSGIKGIITQLVKNSGGMGMEKEAQAKKH